MAALRLFGRPLPIHFALLGRKRKYIKIKDDSKINREKNIDRRGQRHIVNVWHLSDPPSFSLPTTFNGLVQCGGTIYGFSGNNCLYNTQNTIHKIQYTKYKIL